jgi:hypothetical protein
MPDEQWYTKQAYGENYWEGDDFADFLRWYVKKNYTGIALNVDMKYLIKDIISIVEKPYKSFIREEYYNYIKEKYDE